VGGIIIITFRSLLLKIFKIMETKKGKTKTFTLDEDQVKKLEEWQEHIRAIYGEYGHYEYRFSSSGIGQMVEVYSQLTKTTIDLTDVDKW